MDLTARFFEHFLRIGEGSSIGTRWSHVRRGNPTGDERLPKPPTIRNSFTRTLVLDTIMKLSGTIGLTQKTMIFDIHVCQIFEFEALHPAR